MDNIMNTVRTLLLCCLSLISASAVSDVLLIDVIESEPVNSTAGLLRPTHGMTMAQVEAKFGAPEMKYATVGEPPITRWKYEKFSVYYEYNIVLHTVVNKPAKASIQK
jgi:hypothetical protein